MWQEFVSDKELSQQTKSFERTLLIHVRFLVHLISLRYVICNRYLCESTHKSFIITYEKLLLLKFQASAYKFANI